MKESIHIINGNAYTFTTEANKTYLTFKSTSRPATENYVENCTLPGCKIVTRSNGDILFALALKKGTDEKFEILTAQQLYDIYAWQWFEPLADNYHELIYFSNAPETYPVYKHFRRQDIVDFSSIDRLSASYYTGMPGDWKSSANGGDGYLMVMINEVPYWTDAVGQIPFSVDTYRSNRDMKYVVRTGIAWGGGSVTSEADVSNRYDNFFVLRGALFASKKYSYYFSTSPGNYTNTQVNEVINNVDSNCISQPITELELMTYGVWNEK